MYITKDSICRFCQQIFCCDQCCSKHEQTNHSSALSALTEDKKTDKINSDVPSCPICENNPLLFHDNLKQDLLLHIETCHLPLKCQKCLKIYEQIDDMKAFSKCTPSLIENPPDGINMTYQSYCTDEKPKLTVKKILSQSISTQTSPMRHNGHDESNITPLSIINMRWKTKSKLTHEEFISDSVSSIRNTSTISNSSATRNTSTTTTTKGKVIRSTSTPVHLEVVFAKPKEQSFNPNGTCQVSSIYNSGCESDESPALLQTGNKAIESLNRYRKIGTGRTKLSAVTPLRQVMSKSIQKALVEHALAAGSTVSYYDRNRFLAASPAIEPDRSIQPEALDLRLSPAVRRRQGELSEKKVRNDTINFYNINKREILLSAKKTTTESIVITRTQQMSASRTSCNESSISAKSYDSYQTASSNTNNNGTGTIYKSCSCVEIITTTTELSEINIQQNHSDNKSIKRSEMNEKNNQHPKNDSLVPVTPITSLPGTFYPKKLIKFESPKIEINPNKTDVSPEVFLTPSGTPTYEHIPFKNNSDKQQVSKIRKHLMPRNLNGQFSFESKKASKSSPQSHLNNMASFMNHSSEVDDDVLLNEISQSNKKHKILKLKNEEKTVPPQQQHQTEKSSVWSRMGSLIRLSSLKEFIKKSSIEDTQVSYSNSYMNSNSIIKRCASIKGSLVRSKSLIDESEYHTLKRKRNIDNQTNRELCTHFNYIESLSPSHNTSSKRFRIQPRRPISRMRHNNS